MWPDEFAYSVANVSRSLSLPQSQTHLRYYCRSSTTRLTLHSSMLLWFFRCPKPHFLAKDALFDGSESNHPTSPTGNHAFFDRQHAQPLVCRSFLARKLLGSQQRLVSQSVRRDDLSAMTNGGCGDKCGHWRNKVRFTTDLYASATIDRTAYRFVAQRQADMNSPTPTVVVITNSVPSSRILNQTEDRTARTMAPVPSSYHMVED